MNRTVRQIKADIAECERQTGELVAWNEQLQAELAHARTHTLNEQDYGCCPEDMGITGLVAYVRGPHWPYVPESTCFAARMQLAKEIIVKRGLGNTAAQVFEKAVYAGRK